MPPRKDAALSADYGVKSAYSNLSAAQKDVLTQLYKAAESMWKKWYDGEIPSCSQVANEISYGISLAWCGRRRDPSSLKISRSEAASFSRTLARLEFRKLIVRYDSALARRTISLWADECEDDALEARRWRYEDAWEICRRDLGKSPAEMAHVVMGRIAREAAISVKTANQMRLAVGDVDPGFKRGCKPHTDTIYLTPLGAKLAWHILLGIPKNRRRAGRG